MAKTVARTTTTKEVKLTKLLLSVPLLPEEVKLTKLLLSTPLLHVEIDENCHENNNSKTEVKLTKLLLLVPLLHVEIGVELEFSPY